MKNWRIITILLLCVVLADSTACSPFGGGDKEEVSQEPVEVVRGDLTVSVSGSGSIGVSDEARLAFGIGGRVDKIYVKEGDKVTKDEVLAKLDTDSLELALIQAQLALQTSEYELDEAQDLYAKTEVHKARAVVHEAENYLEYARSMLEEAKTAKDIKTWTDEVDYAKTKLRAAEVRLNEMLNAPDTEEVAIKKLQVEVAKQSLEQAQKQLDEATITAPLGGIVANVNASEGDIISSPTMAPTIVIHLIDPSSMELKVEVDEIDIPSVREGQKAVISVDALLELQLEGKVTYISLLPEVEAGVTVYEVKISLDVPQDLRLKVGMSATADIITDERSNVLLVPDRAIKLDSEGNTVVKVMVDGQVQERPVVIGISDGYQTEIVDGLDEGELVVRKAS